MRLQLLEQLLQLLLLPAHHAVLLVHLAPKLGVRLLQRLQLASLRLLPRRQRLRAPRLLGRLLRARVKVRVRACRPRATTRGMLCSVTTPSADVAPPYATGPALRSTHAYLVGVGVRVRVRVRVRVGVRVRVRVSIPNP